MGLSAFKSFLDDRATRLTLNETPFDRMEEMIGYLDCQYLTSSGSVPIHWKEFDVSARFWKYMRTSFYPHDRNTADLLRKYSKIGYIKIDYSEQKVLSIGEKLTRISKDIRGIDIVRLGEVDPSEVQEILKKYPRLESFALCVNPGDVQECINLLGTCKYLQRLVLVGYAVYTGVQTDLKPIVDGCPSLKHIDIQCTLYDIENIEYLLEKYKNQLVSLKCTTGGFSTETLLSLDKCHNLEYISFDFSISSYQTKNVLNVIQSSTKIKAIGLRSCNDTSPDILIKFFTNNSFPSLVELDLSLYRKINKPLAAVIRNRYPQMRKLRLNECFQHNVEGLDELLKLENLVHLELAKVCFAGIWFQRLLQCTNLKYLDLRFCREMRDEHASTLIKYLQLEYLNLSYCLHLSDKFLEVVPVCTTLRELVIYGFFSEEELEILQYRSPFLSIRKNKHTL